MVDYTQEILAVGGLLIIILAYPVMKLIDKLFFGETNYIISQCKRIEKETRRKNG